MLNFCEEAPSEMFHEAFHFLCMKIHFIVTLNEKKRFKINI